LSGHYCTIIPLNPINKREMNFRIQINHVAETTWFLFAYKISAGLICRIIPALLVCGCRAAGITVLLSVGFEASAELELEMRTAA